MRVGFLKRVTAVLLALVLVMTTFPVTQLQAQEGGAASFKMDLAFVVDTTGSMGSEIETAKSNMRNYIAQLEELKIDYRVALVDYRDFPERTGDDDDYACSVISDFSNDEEELLESVNRLELGYGGDDEETVYSALVDGLASLKWRSNVARVSIVIGDAPALDPEPFTGYTFDSVVKTLLGGDASYDENGNFKPTRNHIYVFTVCSGGDSAAQEFFSRLSQATLGKSYTFYETETLNNIILEIINQVSGLEIGVFQSYLNKTSKDQYGIFVVDSYGNAIPGATVTWNDESKQTGGEGYVTFDKFTVGQPKITVTKSGYRSYSNEGTNYTKSDKNYDFITLYADKQSGLSLKSAYYSNETAGRHDILTKMKKINASNKSSFDLDNGKFDVYCRAWDESLAVKYELMQGDKVVYTSTTGDFTGIDVDAFTVGEDIVVRVYDAIGGYVRTPINLEIEKSASVDDIKFGLSGGDKVEIAIPDDVPFVGGTTIKTEMPDLKWEAYIEGNKLHLGYNTKIKEYSTACEKEKDPEKKKDKKKILDEYVKSAKETMETINKYKDQELSKANRDKLKKMMAKDQSLNMPAAGKVSVTFVGYGELEFSESGISSGLINICIAADFCVDKTWQTVVWVVPVVVNVNVGAKVGSTAQLSYQVAERTLNGEWRVNFEPHLEAFGGVGVGKAIGVGATGSANLDIELQILSSEYPFGFNKVDLTGQLGLKAYLAVFTYERAFAHHTWSLYSRTQKTRMMQNYAQVSSQDIYNLDNYEVADISYLEEESEWLGETKAAVFGRRMADTETYQPMLMNTYRNMQPVTAAAADSTVMVYIGAGEGRDAYNIPTLMYSVYDHENDTWGAPVKLDQNDTTDQAPYLYSDGTEIWLVYADTDKVLSEGDDISTFAKHQSIAISKFDNATKAFGTPVVIAESDGRYLSVPEIFVKDGIPTVIWQSNENTDVLGLNSTNEIMYSTYDAGVWSEAESISSDLNSVVGYAIGELNADKSVAYILDADNDLATLDDRTLYVADLSGAKTEIASGVISNPNYAVLPGTDMSSLLFYSEGNIGVYDGSENRYLLEAAAAGFTDKYVVQKDRILYLGATENSSNIFCILYNEAENTWSESVQLTSQDLYIDNLSVFETAGKTVAVMNRKNVQIDEETIDDSCELCWYVMNEKTNLQVESVDYDQNLVVLGENIPLEISLKNIGETRVDSVSVEICDAEGIPVLSEIVSTNLAASESQTVCINLPFENSSLNTYSIRVLPNDGSVDVDMENNERTVEIGYTDLETTAEALKIGNKYYVYASVKNNSYVPTAGVLEIYNHLDEETVLADSEFGTLDHGESITVMFPVDEETVGGMEGIMTIKATAEAEEYFMYNNSASCLVNMLRTVYAEKVTITADTLYALEGENIQLGANVFPAETTNQEVIWSSADESIAIVSEDGVVTSRKNGEIQIKATTVDGGFADTVTVKFDHNFGEWEVTKEATETADGEKMRVCSMCGHEETEAVKYYYQIHLDETVRINVNAGEITYLKFIPEMTGIYNFYSISEEDTYGYIFDSDFEQLGYNDDGDGSNFFVECQLYEGEVYYLGASYYNSSMSGNFDVSVEWQCMHNNTIYDSGDYGSCKKDGISEGVFCEDCNTWISGHEVVKGFHKDADKNRVCDVCKKSLKNDIDTQEAMDVCVEGEVVYLEFVPDVSGIYTFFSNSTTDTYGYLYDSEKNIITSNDDSGEKNNFSISYELTEDVKYYWGVRYYSSYDTGNIPVMLRRDSVSSSHVHKYSTEKVLKTATENRNGSQRVACPCGSTNETTIPKVSSVKLSKSNYTYNGKTQKPSVTVKNSKGTTLKSGTDYTVSYASGRTKIGKYKVTVTFKGNYSGSKALYFEIGPKNLSSVKTALYGYDDVKVSWSKVSGVSGYKVYYKKASDSSWILLKTTKSTSYKKSGLSDGVKYDFKVVAYKNVRGNACENAGKTSSIYTLKKITGVEAAKSSSKVKVSWTNISGETGYQISQSTSKLKTNIVSTYKTTSGKSKTVSATKGKTYYYKVRVYKEVAGKKIYGPWSSVVKYKR